MQDNEYKFTILSRPEWLFIAGWDNEQQTFYARIRDRKIKATIFETGCESYAQHPDLESLNYALPTIFELFPEASEKLKSAQQNASVPKPISNLMSQLYQNAHLNPLTL